MSDQPAHIVPRRILGPDAVKALRDLSRSITGDRWAFDTYKVQRSANGDVMRGFDLDAMEYVGNHAPDSYGTFLKHQIIPRTEEIGAEITELHLEDRFEFISKLIAGSNHDTKLWWILSGHSVRRYIFPGAYEPTKRVDNVTYLFNPKDHHRGRVVNLRSLTPSGVRNFADYALKMTNGLIDPAVITPIQPNNETKAEEL